MEEIIAKHCRSISNDVGYYRYPVVYKKGGHRQKVWGTVGVRYEEISSMHYEFGSNYLEIGDALLEILEFLDRHIESEVPPFDYYDEDDD